MSISTEEVNAQAELTQDLKLKRGYAKSSVTRRMRDIKDQMKSNADVRDVLDKLKEFTFAVDNLHEAHEEYHSCLVRESQLEESRRYLALFRDEVNWFREETSQWCQVNSRLQEAADAMLRTTPSPSDDVLSHHSHTSKSSSRRSIASAKVKVAAKKASLQAEMEALDERRALEQQELLLNQQKRAFNLKVELAKADAENMAYSEIESDIRSHISKDVTSEKKEDLYKIVHVDVHKEYDTAIHNTPESKESSRHIIHESAPQREIEHELPSKAALGHHTQANRSTLNPEANPWNNCEQPVHRERASSSSNDHMLELIHQQQQQQRQLVDAIQLPKTDLLTFDGNPVQYWGFMRSFEHSVENHCTDPNAKLLRLLQYCTGKAKRVIQCCSAIDPEVGYPKAKNLLKERFGNDYVIAEAWMEKVTEGTGLKPSDSEALQDFSDELINCYETLQAMDKLVEIDSQRCLVKIVRKLPVYLQNQWRKRAHDISKFAGRAHIRDLVEFVKDSAEVANDPIFGNIVDNSKDQGSKVPFKKPLQKPLNATGYSTKARSDTVPSDPGDQQPFKSKCPMCTNEHTLFGCDQFKAMSPEDRLYFVREKRLCHNCLIPGHYAYKCYKQSSCNVPGCGRKHTRFLHQVDMPRYNSQNSNSNDNSPRYNADNSVSRASNHDSIHNEHVDVGEAKCSNAGTKSNSEGTVSHRIALPVVPVRVHSPAGRVIETYALLDSGSTNTFCAEELLNVLGLSGSREKLSLSTLEKANSVIDTNKTSLAISDIHDNNFVTLPIVYSRPMLPFDAQCIMNQNDLQIWPHLQDLNMPHIDEKKVMLLIGQDVPDVLVPIEVRSGPKGSPYATRSLLGWSLNGPFNMAASYNVISNFCQIDQGPDRQVENFWEPEEVGELIGDGHTEMSVKDKQAMSLWDESTKLNNEYEMAIPFKCRLPQMPHNIVVAENRLNLMAKMLHKKDSGLHEKYNSGIDDLSNKGYAEVVPQEVRIRTHAYTKERRSSDLPMNQLFSRFSYWYHLKKVVTWILKVRKKLDWCIHPCCYDVCYGLQTLTDESLSTIMCQIEEII